MDIQRIKELETKEISLTKEELEEGWHFCPDWDYMVINKYTSPEAECCLCEKHKVSLECLGGASAHPDNWYCPICDELTRLQAENERQQEEIERLNNETDEKCDRHYRAGFTAGWNAGVSGDEKTREQVENRLLKDNQ